MGSRHYQLDPLHTSLRPLSERKSELSYAQLVPLPDITSTPLSDCRDMVELVAGITKHRPGRAPVILFLGGHVVKTGMTLFICDLIQHRWISHVAMNGATLIHDFELFVHGATSESVPDYLPDGQFGMWQETSFLNELARRGATAKLGYGEVVGNWMRAKLAKYSNRAAICRTCASYGVPVTVHPLLGGDIIHAHPNFDGAATGAVAATDFAIFAKSVSQLGSAGTFINIGSAVHGPEVFLKALSAARNQSGNGQPKNFTTAVFDMAPPPPGWRDRPEDKAETGYYNRGVKTILRRAVCPDGKSFYLRGVHTDTISQLWLGLRFFDKIFRE